MSRARDGGRGAQVQPSGSIRQFRRCAIYTRVSSDAGLEQDFNSLDAQREAAEAYVKSQAHEGWKLLPGHYNDGGYSGGSMERPALQKLLADIHARRIDVVVVYKVDRLTRSLADFAKLVDVFDAHEVSFVSVTQAFNTTTSMGRLTLNVLLSFAQFEREVTGERIRDKIAASKKKGIWMGGVVPFGYRVEERRLLVEPAEAAIVRMIFERYLALGSLPALQQELRGQQIVSRVRTLANGKTIGGRHFTNGPLVWMLRNRVYLGEINHRDRSYPGEHEAIIPQDLFDAVQSRLNENRQGARLRHQASQALLKGRLFDDRGNPMTPSYAIKNGVRYRYYVSCVLAQGRKDEAGTIARVAASEIEAHVLATLRTCVPAFQQHQSSATGDQSISDHDRMMVQQLLSRIELRAQGLQITLAPGAAFKDGSNQLFTNWTPPSHRRHRQIIAPASTSVSSLRPIRAEARSRLVLAIAKARLWLNELVHHKTASIQQIAQREGRSERSIRMTLTLAFLSPEIVRAAIDGTLPRGLGLSQMTDLPSDWSEQKKALGLA